jgi:hypothetical protein
MIVNEFRTRAVPTRRSAARTNRLPCRAQAIWIGLPTLKGLRPSRAEGIAALPARRPGGLRRGDAGLGAGRHFAATGTAMPGIFNLASLAAEPVA